MKQNKLFISIIIISSIVFILTVLSLVFDQFLTRNFDVIGIRIAMLVVAFASFGSSTLFSLLILSHNRMVVSMNQDLNTRAELFRELQFTASHYSVIDFMDRMIIFLESDRYIDRYIKTGQYLFHMFEKSVDPDHVKLNPQYYKFYSFKIPFKVVEGKLVSKIMFHDIYFERGDIRYFFNPPRILKEGRAYLLYNEQTHRNNIIINLVVKKDSDFFDPSSINAFSKIKMHLSVTSLLGVTLEGMSELYFTNPEKIEGDNTNTYKINSSNFIIKDRPFIDHNIQSK
jgi:hypothetical protein